MDQLIYQKHTHKIKIYSQNVRIEMGIASLLKNMDYNYLPSRNTLPKNTLRTMNVKRCDGVDDNRITLSHLG